MDGDEDLFHWPGLDSEIYALERRLAEGLSPLLETLPEGPLKHSYPDWIAEVWERDLGREDALAGIAARQPEHSLN